MNLKSSWKKPRLLWQLYSINNEVMKKDLYPEVTGKKYAYIKPVMHASNAVERFVKNVIASESKDDTAEAYLKEAQSLLRGCAWCAVAFSIVTAIAMIVSMYFNQDVWVHVMFVITIVALGASTTLHCVSLSAERVTAACCYRKLHLTSDCLQAVAELKAFSKNVDSKVSAWKMERSGRYNKAPKDDASES